MPILFILFIFNCKDELWPLVSTEAPNGDRLQPLYLRNLIRNYPTAVRGKVELSSQAAGETGAEAAVLRFGKPPVASLTAPATTCCIACRLVYAWHA